MAENESKEKAKPIVYIGNDKSYWTTIKQRFQGYYPDKNFVFKVIYEAKAENFQKTFVQIIKEHPKIVFIDLSERTEQHMTLAQLMEREPSLHDVAMIGLVEDKEYVRDCLSAGVDVIHVKCGEYHDVVYDAMMLSYPKEVKTPQFAKAKLNSEIEIIDDFRMGYITPTSIHAEGNLKLEKAQTIIIESEIPKKNIPSKKFLVKDITEFNLYYNYKYAYDLEFKFVDEPEFSEDEHDDALGEQDEEKRVRMLKEAKRKRQDTIAEYETNLKSSKKNHADWIEDKMDLSTPKKTKVMIIDPGLRVLTEEGIKPIDQYPFSCRVATRTSETMHEIEVVRPNVIAIQVFGENDDMDENFKKAFAELESKGFVLEDLPEGEEPSETEEEKHAIKQVIIGMKDDELERIDEIIKKIKTIEGYTPFIVLFNCTFATSKSLQDSYQYPMIVVHSENMKLEEITNLAGLLQTKQEQKIDQKLNEKVQELKSRDPNKYRKLTTADFVEKRYYVKKSSPLSHVSCRFPINLMEISESELTFQSSEEFELRTYRMNFPIEMSIRIMPKDGKAFQEVSGKKEYFALIHSIDEVDKKSIRRYVNEIFFEPLKEKRSAEKAEWNDKHQKAVQQRQKMMEEESKRKEKAAAKAAAKSKAAAPESSESDEDDED